MAVMVQLQCVKTLSLALRHCAGDQGRQLCHQQRYWGYRAARSINGLLV